MFTLFERIQTMIFHKKQKIDGELTAISKWLLATVDDSDYKAKTSTLTAIYFS